MQIFGMSAENQIVLIDGQTQQIIVDPSQITYQTDENVTFSQPQAQTIYYMDNSGSSETPTMEMKVPIVLNHSLGSQISLVPQRVISRPALVQQAPSVQLQRTTLPRQQQTVGLNQINPQIQQTGQIPSRAAQYLKTDPPSLTISRGNQIVRMPTAQQPQFQRTESLPISQISTSQGTMISGIESPSSEVTLQPVEKNKEDGAKSIVSMPKYKHLVMKQQQPPRPNIKATIARPQNNPNLMQRPRLVRPPLNQTGPRPRPPIRQAADEGLHQVQRSGNPQVQHQNARNQQPRVVQQPQPAPRHNNHDFIIQPPRNNPTPGMIKPLPKCISTEQVQEIINNTPIGEEYQDSIRMLILLTTGEQRLITFTLPKESCSIAEILEQVGVPFNTDTYIDVQEVYKNKINYIVTVGDVNYFNSTLSSDASQKSSSSEESQKDVSSTSKSSTPNREPSPEPIKEQPKFIPGMLAVCINCGYISEDFNRCLRCRRKLPDNVKSVPVAGNKIESKWKAMEKKELHTNGSVKDAGTVRKKVTKLKVNESEPVILLSSDEEDDDKKLSKTLNASIIKKLGSSITVSPIKKEPSNSDLQKTASSIEENSNEHSESQKNVAVHCRTIRIGSYRFVPKENVTIDYSSVNILAPHVSREKEFVRIRIDRNDIVKVLISFQKQLLVLFYYLRPHTGALIRNMLGMADGQDVFFDPLSENESQRRITLLPENIADEAKLFLQQIYMNSSNSILDELTCKEANDILIKTCPKELTQSALYNMGLLNEVQTILTYPPEGRGRISINTEDYMCLASDQFLNDVIIDFYLKYLVDNLSTEEQEKVHVFSTFFYKRLTTKPVKASRKSQPSELDPNLSPSEKRHTRVKTWTKNIDLFSKDFIIVPINENCHWFLAIICFPGMDGFHTMEGQPIKIDIQPKSKKKIASNVTISNVKKENDSIVCDNEESDKDEAEGDDSELESDEAEDNNTSQVITSQVDRPPIKQPCILIFDSLAGASRSRVVATLRDYLTCEYKVKMGKEKLFTKDVIKGSCVKVPQQTNFTDCGLYLLQYVEHFFMEPIKDYYLPITQLKTWFDEHTVTRKREDICILIRSLMMESDKDIEMLPEIMLPTKNGFLVDQLGEEEEDEEMEEGMSDDDFHDPRIDREMDPDGSFSSNEEQHKVNEEDLRPSTEGASDQHSLIPSQQIDAIKPDASEVSKASNKDTLHYLKTKRIERHREKSQDSVIPLKRLKSGKSADE